MPTYFFKLEETTTTIYFNNRPTLSAALTKLSVEYFARAPALTTKLLADHCQTNRKVRRPKIGDLGIPKPWPDENVLTMNRSLHRTIMSEPEVARARGRPEDRHKKPSINRGL
jgi:hypothetical protein